MHRAPRVGLGAPRLPRVPRPPVVLDRPWRARVTIMARCPAPPNNCTPPPPQHLPPPREPVAARAAATVLLLRDAPDAAGAGGLEVLMTRRSAQASFAP